MLQRGAKRLYQFLRSKTAGDIVAKADIIESCGWKESTFRTYRGKNKLSHVLEVVDDEHMKVLQHGHRLGEDDFNAVFTQRR